MGAMQDYNSSLSNTASRKFETFSYLPPLSEELSKIRDVDEAVNTVAGL